ncbi:MAG TPA: cytochrome c biogenesis protein DipZ [Rectinemataceae bacterium]|nr:cytochrome c biogenesis protein DipZ [Rectinemataceae bacterium]
MAVLLVFAFVSGVITILSPCILPVLPIVLSGSVGGGKARPLGIISGFVASFTVFTLSLSALVQALNIPPDALRYLAVVLIGLFGLVMVIPPLGRAFEAAASRLAGLGSRGGSKASARTGFGPGLLIGLSLGLIWTPCVGPIMASVISLALTQRVDGGSVLITLAYTLGTSIPMFAVMMGGRALLTKVPALVKRSASIQRGFGVLMLLVAVAVGFGWDRRFQAAVLAAFPNYGSGLTAIETTAPVRTALQARSSRRAGGLGAGGSAMAASGVFAGASQSSEGGVLADLGAAPRLVADGQWFNSPPLSMAALRGKVVLVDFWTYSCVNCVRTIPYLKAWYKAYAPDGFVIIGVHSPEFTFEKVAANVGAAIRDLGVTWPVVQDNDYKEWNAYANNYWPAHYFIDAKGRVRYVHYGEGEYDVSEKVIRELLAEAGHPVGSASPQAVAAAGAPLPDFQALTPETYLGYARGSGFTSATTLLGDQVTDYKPSRTPGDGEWSLQGPWLIGKEYISPQASGLLELGFHAKNVFLVIAPQGAGGTVSVEVDGRPGGDTPDVKGGMLRPKESRLYQLVGLPQAGTHLLRLQVSGNLRLYAFTFG